ncbi:MAG: hypothetical protein CR993_09860, partial [Rhodobacterales bacterium]
MGSDIHPGDGLTPAAQGVAVLFVVSAYTLSRGALARLEAAALAGAPGAARLIRLEETGPDLLTTLDQMRAEGHRRIRVQPFGFPFPESLLTWLPGVLAHWRARGNTDTEVSLGPDPGRDAVALKAFAAAALAGEARPVEGTRPRLGKPGWSLPPDFDFHLLVCTGPRCAIHGA